MIDTKNLNLHIMFLDKFIPPFIDFINQNFPPEEHLFVIYGKAMPELEYHPTSANVISFNSFNNFFYILPYINVAKRIIIHGLFFEEVVNLFNQMPQEILDKVYWVMWGGDFYFPEEQSQAKINLIKKIRNVITNDYDYKYLTDKYEVKPKNFACIMYPSNVYDPKNYEHLKENSKSELWILVGNSAAPTNRHLFVFDKLKKFKQERIKIVVPLSYGKEKNYIRQVVEVGKEIFREKIIFIFDFLNYAQYLQILFNVHIGIFYQNRSQGFGNIIQLLGLGKKIYLDQNQASYKYFSSLGIKVYSFDDEFDFNFDVTQLSRNADIIKKKFSIDSLLSQWKEIFSN